MQRKKEARYHCLEADSIFLLLKINLTSDQAAKYEFILRLYLNPLFLRNWLSLAEKLLSLYTEMCM